MKAPLYKLLKAFICEITSHHHHVITVVTVFGCWVHKDIPCHYCRPTAVTTEIPLKECSAYGQIDQGGGEKGENYIYELPQ